MTLERPSKFYFMLLLMPMIMPSSLYNFPLLNIVLPLWKVLTILYLTLYLIPKSFRSVPLRITPSLYFLGIFWIIYLAGCIRVGAELGPISSSAFASILIFLLIACQLRFQNGVMFLSALSAIFTGFILAHIVSVPLVRFGLLNLGGEEVYLFGMDNYSAFFLYPMVSVVLFYHALHYGSLRPHSWLLLISVVAVYLYTRSMTAAGAGLVMLVLYAVRPLLRHMPRMRSIWWIVAGMALILYLICFHQIQNYLATLLDQMSKGVTLNSRTYIWAEALDLIVQRPIFGHGPFTQVQITDHIMYGTTHAHNLLLELLVRTGIVGTAAYLAFLCGIFRSKKSHCADSILIFGLICQLILSFMDFYPTILCFYIFMGIVYYRADFCRQFEQKRSALADRRRSNAL